MNPKYNRTKENSSRHKLIQSYGSQRKKILKAVSKTGSFCGKTLRTMTDFLS